MTIEKIKSLVAGDIMTKRVGSTTASTVIMEAVKELFVRNIGALVVCNDDNEVVGMFTERDILRRVIPENIKIKKAKVQDVMTEHPTTVGPQTSILEVYDMMHGLNFRHVPVVEDNKLVGIVSIKDIADAFIKYIKD